jgi:hypothetical protein
MTQVAALLRPKVTSEIIQEKKAKQVYLTLMDWYRIGREDSVPVTFFTSGVTRDRVKVKVSLA